MNDPLVNTLSPVVGEERLARLLDWLDTTARTVGDFAAEQTPLLVQEIIAWGFWSQVVAAVLWAVAWLVAFCVGRWLFRLGTTLPLGDRRGLPHRSEGACFAMSFGTIIRVAAFFLLIGTAVHTTKAVKVSIAPRLYVLEYVQRLVR